ncbi:MAG: hypothetical protein IT292_07040 [Deltaproteobacteria bacterium]|nr:hypothetical protein [Deltaproteobacteria bacterium]
MLVTDLREDEERKLRNAKTEEEWFQACEEVKAGRGGNYLEDWREKVVLSGLVFEKRVTFLGGVH